MAKTEERDPRSETGLPSPLRRDWLDVWGHVGHIERTHTWDYEYLEGRMLRSYQLPFQGVSTWLIHSEQADKLSTTVELLIGSLLDTGLKEEVSDLQSWISQHEARIARLEWILQSQAEQLARTRQSPRTVLPVPIDWSRTDAAVAEALGHLRWRAELRRIEEEDAYQIVLHDDDLEAALENATEFYRILAGGLSAADIRRLQFDFISRSDIE